MNKELYYKKFEDYVKHDYQLDGYDPQICNIGYGLCCLMDEFKNSDSYIDYLKSFGVEPIKNHPYRFANSIYNLFEVAEFDEVTDLVSGYISVNSYSNNRSIVELVRTIKRCKKTGFEKIIFDVLVNRELSKSYSFVGCAFIGDQNGI